MFRNKPIVIRSLIAFVVGTGIGLIIFFATPHTLFFGVLACVAAFTGVYTVYELLDLFVERKKNE